MNTRIERNLFLDYRRRFLQRVYPTGFLLLTLFINVWLGAMIVHQHKLITEADQMVYDVVVDRENPGAVFRLAGFTMQDKYNCTTVIASNLEDATKAPDLKVDRIDTCIPGEIADELQIRHTMILLGLVVGTLFQGFAFLMLFPLKSVTGD